ncbi:response regulator transcription factor [Halomonas salifodinae]|uniref:Response regulator transcription factor n=1 Tax=Halomonas salifodinae TaxID=438745 RepID=A0ABW2EVZ7_9GAMM
MRSPILMGITDGLTNVEIADRLHISEKAVRNHISHRFSKLGVHSRAQAIFLVRDHGLDA